MEPVIVEDGETVEQVNQKREQDHEMGLFLLNLVGEPSDFDAWKSICRTPPMRERTAEDVVDEDDSIELEDTFEGNARQQSQRRTQQEEVERRNIDASGAAELAYEYEDPRFKGFKMMEWKPFDWKTHGISTPVVGQQVVLMPAMRTLNRPFDVDRAAWKALNWNGRIIMCLLHGGMRSGESNDNRMFKVRARAPCPTDPSAPTRLPATPLWIECMYVFAPDADLPRSLPQG